MIGRIVIEDIRPQVDCGQFTSRAVAGQTVPVEATIFRDGHNEVVAAAVRLTGPGDRPGAELAAVDLGTDVLDHDSPDHGKDATTRARTGQPGRGASVPPWEPGAG